MSKFVWIGFGLLVACLVVGCAKSDDDVMKEQIASMKEFSAELDKIDSQEAAEKAKGKIEAISRRLEENTKVIKSWPEARQKEMSKKYEKELTDAYFQGIESAEKAKKAGMKEVPGFNYQGK